MVHGKEVYFLPLYLVATFVTFCHRFQIQVLAVILEVYLLMYWLMQMTLFACNLLECSSTTFISTGDAYC